MALQSCDPLALASQPDLTPSAAPSEGTSSCKKSCSGDKALDSMAQTQPIQEEPDDIYSSGKFAGNEIVNHSSVPDCCHGKVAPCCDTSCLDRLAMRASATSAAAGPSDIPTATGRKAGNILSSLDQYSATLQALGCICRTLIARGEETCCEIRERHSPASTDCPNSARRCLHHLYQFNGKTPAGLPTESNSSKSCRSKGKSIKLLLLADDRVDLCSTDEKSMQEAPRKQRSSCCSSGNDSSTVPPDDIKYAKPCHFIHSSEEKPDFRTGNLELCCSETPRIDESAVNTSCPDSNCQDYCLDKDQNTDSCCLKTGPFFERPASACAASCCGTKNEKLVTKELLIAESSDCKQSKQDVVQTPKGSCAKPRMDMQIISSQESCANACCFSAAPNPGLQFGTLVLSISGMTCTGCETKLKRTLASVAAVQDLKTSLVLSRVEFNINLRLGSVEDVMKHLERTTEFKCERVQSHGSSLDFIISYEPSEIINRAWPDGVIDVVAVNKKTLRVASKHVRHIGYMTLLSAVLTIPVLVMAWAPLPEREVAYSSASLALATIVQFAIAGPFYPKAIKALLFSRVIETDLLIVLSSSAAYIFSVVSFGYLAVGKPLSTGQFFETSTLLVALIMVGRWLSALARQRAVESISIRSLQASTAVLVDEEGQREREIDTRLLQYGDVFQVFPDSKVPTDGTVINGTSEVNESMLTGESRPVDKYPGSAVIAGSINGSGTMTVRLNRLPSENTINTIAVMVDEAKLSKPKLQDLADRVAAYFVPIIVALTIITFTIWAAVGMLIRGNNGSEATIQAVTYAITVLIVSCPCAIGLAVHMVIVISSGIAAEKGIIFKSADAIELAHKTSHVVFDKTGTLTRGKLSIVAQHCIDGDKLRLLLGLTENSRHPVSVSVAAHLKDAGIVALTVPESKSLTGKGVEAILDGQSLRAGNSHWLDLSEHALVQPMLARGYTVLCFTIENDLVAAFGLEDELRPDASMAIEILKGRGVSVHVVSGDDEGAVQKVAVELSIPSGNIRSRSSPADKKNYIEKLLGDGTDHKELIVMFCGDGTNDAIALARATIGVHMNEGTDVAQSAADVVLMRPSLTGIPVMMNASRAAVNRIKFNFTWSVIYNTFAILLAAGAFVNARIPPEFAGLGELVSVLPVIAAAVLLRWSNI
ncbi:hypothetical protein N7540_003563 [Penicillium herquei]|nr:hypothetical protein N7540_003563 [Penicillium herquei]